MPRAEINKRNLPYGIGNDPAAVPANDTLVTWIIPLTYASAADLSGTLTPLLGGTVAAYAQTNSLMVTDTCSNIRRVLEIVKNFDVPGEEQELAVLPLKHAQAWDLSQEILQVLDKQPSAAAPAGAVPAPAGRGAPAPVSGAPAGGSKSAATIIPETHTNSLIVVASRSVMDRIRGSRRAARHGALAEHREHSRRLPRKRRGQGHGQIAGDRAAELDGAER